FLQPVVGEHTDDKHDAGNDQAEKQRVHRDPAAACRGRLSASSSASAMSTATTRDTPGSGIVMPINCAAISMVILLWLMNRNCVTSAMVRTMAQKRSVFGSSSGASTSSSRQNGAGLSWNSANTRPIAVMAFSPPDSRWIDVLRLP